VAAAHARLRRDIPHLHADRFLRPDLEKLTSLYSSLPESVLAAAEKAVGPLA